MEGSGREDRWERSKFPMPRDLNDPDGCRFSSLRWIWQPACLERVGEWMSGVWRQGVGRSDSGCAIFGSQGA